MASFALFSDGRLLFENEHADNCQPNLDMGNDGYVFNLGLSPTKNIMIISNITDMLSGYGTTAAAARKQI